METRPEIRFPRQMEITSPAIDSLSTTAQHLSKWLHTDLREILRPLQTLPELPKILASLKEGLVQQFHQLLSGQTAVQMKAREANIRVNRRKAELTERHLEKKRQQLEDATRRIESRYDNLAMKAIEQHEGYLKDLDSHAYDLIERIYPDEIRKRFSADSDPYWRAMAAHLTETAALRSACLSEGYMAARFEVTSYLEKRDRAWEQIGDLTARDIESGPMELTYYFAVVEDMESGERRVEVFFPWQLDESTSPEPDLCDSLNRLADQQIDFDSAIPISFRQLSTIGDHLKKQGVPEAEILRLSSDCTQIVVEDSAP